VALKANRGIGLECHKAGMFWPCGTHGYFYCPCGTQGQNHSGLVAHKAISWQPARIRRRMLFGMRRMAFGMRRMASGCAVWLSGCAV